MATDVGMRWDGVHVYKPGAKLIFDTIAPALLAMLTGCAFRAARAGVARAHGSTQKSSLPPSSPSRA